MEKGRQGHIVQNVVPGGVGQRCGLRDGDRLLEVNNGFVDDLPHPEVTAQDRDRNHKALLKLKIFLFFQVARKIKLSGNQLSLLVVDGDVYEKSVSRGQNPRKLSRILRGEDCKPPRLCHITKDPVSGLGINFTPVEGNGVTGSLRSKVPHKRDTKTRLLHFVLCRRERSFFSEPH